MEMSVHRKPGVIGVRGNIMVRNNMSITDFADFTVITTLPVSERTINIRLSALIQRLLRAKDAVIANLESVATMPSAMKAEASYQRQISLEDNS